MHRIWLRKLREDADKTHDEVAKEAGISRSFYTNIERGIKNPSVEVAKKIATILKFDWTLFFTNECSLKEQNKKKQVS